MTGKADGEFTIDGERSREIILLTNVVTRRSYYRRTQQLIGYVTDVDSSPKII